MRQIEQQQQWLVADGANSHHPQSRAELVGHDWWHLRSGHSLESATDTVELSLTKQ
jgi:hypothetical protein